jgi:integrase
MGEVIKKMKDGRFIGWYLRYIDADGKRKQRASQKPGFAEARRMLIEVEARIVRGLAGLPDRVPKNRRKQVAEDAAERGAEAPLTVAALLEVFVARGSRPQVKDAAAYRQRVRFSLARVKSAAPQLMKLPLPALSRQHVARLRDALCERHPSGTVRNSLTALSAALSWAVAEALIPSHPGRGVEPPPPPPPQLDFLTLDEVRRLLAEAERQARADKSLMAFSRWVAVSLALRLGLRRGELFGLRWQDIEVDAGRLTVARSYRTTPKSGKPRHLRLPDPLRALLVEWRPLCPEGPEQLVCPALYRGAWGMYRDTGSGRSLLNLYKAAGCRALPRPWHLLRHTMASHFVQSGGSLLALSQILGHSDVKTTMIYAHLSSDFLAGELNKIKY